MPDPGPSIDRRAYWARRLRRLRLDDSPLESRLGRLRRVTWALTIVPIVMASIPLAILTAFRAPVVGLVVAGVIAVPIVSTAWIDYGRLSRDVRRYREEHGAAGLDDRGGGS